MLLQELIKLSSHKPKVTPGSLEEQYYKLLKRNAKEEKIRTTLPFTNENHFRQIKFRLKWKLIDEIVAQTTFSGTTAFDEYSDAYKLFTIGKILVAKQARKTGIEILEKAVPKALNQGQIGIALEAIKPISTYYSARVDGLKKLKYYQSLSKDLLKKLHAETIARDNYNDVVCHYSYHWHEDIADKAFHYCSITAPLIDASMNTANLHYSTLYLAHTSALDFEGLLKATYESISYFSKFEKPHRTAISNAYLNRTVALIHLKRYEEACQCTDHVIKFVEKGQYSYCTAYYYRGIAGLHSGKIDITLEALDKIEAYRSKLPVRLQELILILEAYAALFSSRKFKIGRFLNQVPIFDKDKAEANAAIIIVQMLHYIKDANTHAYIDRCEALFMYTRRHLKGKKKILAQLLLEVSKGHFSYTTVQYRTRKLIKRLTGQERELEIMPAERIWGLVMEWLK